ncbi:MAG TPA: hypothetical protein HA282_02900 [Nanoarchaeota archaeon]|nr:hypothetical protein [Nanoarchaeota archaeon]
MAKLIAPISSTSLLDDIALHEVLNIDGLMVNTDSGFGCENMYFFNIARSDVPRDRYDRPKKLAVYERELEYMGINVEELLKGITPKSRQSWDPEPLLEVLIGRKKSGEFISRKIYFCEFGLEKTFGENINLDQYKVTLYTSAQRELKSHLYDTYPSFDFVPKISVNSETAEKLEKLLKQSNAGVVLAYSRR